MTVNFHGIVFNYHRFIYADCSTSGGSIHIHLEGLSDTRKFICLPVKNKAQAEEYLAELDTLIHNHVRAEYSWKK